MGLPEFPRLRVVGKEADGKIVLRFFSDEEVVACANEYDVTSYVAQHVTVIKELQRQQDHLSNLEESFHFKIKELMSILSTLDLLEADDTYEKPIVIQADLNPSTRVSATLTSRPNTIKLWIGADSMLDVTISEGRALLQDQIAQTETRLHDISVSYSQLLRDSVALEVNLSRMRIMIQSRIQRVERV